MISRTNATLHQAVIALGANLAEPGRQLHTAATRIAAMSAGKVLASSIWTTAPVGFSERVPDFANAVMVIETGHSADDLFLALQQLEREMGRERSAENRYLSRRIDLDLVDFAGEVLKSERLTLPHPRARERLFVLLPLQEALPDFRFPDVDLTLDQLISAAPPMMAKRSSPLIPSA